MKAMLRRVAALEAGQESDLSPAVKAWLGWPLTEAEQVALKEDRPKIRAVKTTPFSKEEKSWLGID